METRAVQPMWMQAVAAIKFAADEPTVAAGGFASTAEALVARFSFREVQVQAGPFNWVASTGELKTETKTLLVNNAMGGARDLSVSVDGDSTSADQVLKATWEILQQGHGTAAKLEERGLLYHLTTVVAKLPSPFEDLFPAARTLRDVVRPGLERDGFSPPANPMFRFSIDLTSTWSGLSVPLEVRFEPRFGTMDQDQVFFTSSPLRSEEHLALLERICQTAKSSAA